VPPAAEKENNEVRRELLRVAAELMSCERAASIRVRATTGLDP